MQHQATAKSKTKRKCQNKRSGRHFTATWKLWYAHLNRTAMLICGGVLLSASLLIRLLCGSPIASRAALSLHELLPSFFLMTWSWRLWYFLLGCVFGAVMFSDRDVGVICLRSVEKYRGGMYFVAMIFLGFMWYPLFFVTGRFTLATLLSFIVTGLAILCACSYGKISRVAGGILFAHAGYLLILSVRSLRVLFVA